MNLSYALYVYNKVNPHIIFLDTGDSLLTPLLLLLHYITYIISCCPALLPVICFDDQTFWEKML